MRQYRKKPVVVDAVQYIVENRNEILKWVVEEGGMVYSTGIGDYGERYELENLKLRTLHGMVTVVIEDWIIKGPSGDFWPCKPDIFETTYESCELPAEFQ